MSVCVVSSMSKTLVVGRGDALHSMGIIGSGGDGGLCVLPLSSPLPWEQLKKFTSTKLWVLFFFLSLPCINPLAAEGRQLECGK